MSTEEDKLKRNIPPSFPLGLRIGLSDDAAIIDLLDTDLEKEVFYSFCLSKSTARSLLKSLKIFLEEPDQS